MLKLIFALIAVAVAVPAGGLLAGVDRRLTARLQSRQGPPLLQPFYDVLKLFGKAPCVTNPWLIFSSYVCLMASAIALLMFFMQGDMLLLFFVMTVGAVFKVAGALSADSPYSNVGAQRELLQMLAYEPLVILTFVGMSAATGSFMISDIYALDVPLLPHLPFLFIALGYALTIKLAKSPFDIASCHHGHQEIVRGVLTDYSGPQLALLEISHWLDVILLLGLCSLFWHTSITGMVVLLVLTYALEIVVDNVCARMTWGWMLKHAFGITLGTTQMDKINAVSLTFHYSGKIIVGTYTKRTGTETKAVRFIRNRFYQFNEILLRAHDTGQTQNGVRRIIRMDHQLHPHLIGHRSNLFQEEDKIGTELFGIDIIVSVEGFLELLNGETLFGTGKTGNHITDKKFLVVFAHLFETGFRLGNFFGCIILLGIGAFEDEQIESHKSRLFKTKGFRTVGQSISKIRTGPVEHRHEIVSDNHHSTLRQITDALFIILDISHEISGLSLDMFVYGYTFDYRPGKTDFFNHLLPLHDLLHCPHFSVRDVMKGIYYSGGTGLLDIPQVYRVIRTVPAPSLFT